MMYIFKFFIFIMSINSELQNLKFLLNAGISEFLQNNPNPKYHIQNEKKDTIKIMPNNIQDIDTLDSLEQFIRNYDKCTLRKKAAQTVFADGNPSAKIMLIGEAPGAEEDKLGKPFVGRAGQLLDKMLAAIKLDRNMVYITNVVPWRPPSNREPSSDEILQCLPFIQKHIEIVNPSMLVLLGGTAAKAILTTNHGITKLRGSWHTYNSPKLNHSIPTRAIFHPAFLLRSPARKKEAWEDLLAIQKKL